MSKVFSGKWVPISLDVKPQKDEEVLIIFDITVYLYGEEFKIEDVMAVDKWDGEKFAFISKNKNSTINTEIKYWAHLPMAPGKEGSNEEIE